MDKTASRIRLGCMRLFSFPHEKAVRHLVDTSLENNITLFDHADIYDAGGAEALFGKTLPPSYRDRIVLQSKCSIRPGICYNDYVVAKNQKAFRRAALWRSKTALLFCHIFIAWFCLHPGMLLFVHAQ